MTSRTTFLAATACVAALSALGTTPARANDELLKLQTTSGQWAIPAGNYSSQRYSDLKQINTSTAKNLRPVWTFSTGVLRGHEGGPLVIGDRMFISTPYPNKVFALDLNKSEGEPGRIVWSYEPRQDPNVIPVMCCDTVNRGVAYGNGLIFLHQADTTLVALDEKTGKVVWSVKDDNPGKGL
jgi:glucose dehydrogenase